MSREEDAYITYLGIIPTLNNSIFYQTSRNLIYNKYDEPGLVIRYTIHGFNKPTEESRLVKILISDIKEGKIPFLKYIKKEFYIDIEKIRLEQTDVIIHSWIKGFLKITPKYHSNISKPSSSGIISTQASLVFNIGAEEMEQIKPKKIFLSHKSSNKPKIRDLANTLRQLGLEPWLDEDDMPAGRKLNRSLLQGMNDSCAAVFFITPDYKDINYIENEIDYAIDCKMKRGDDFSIIVLEMSDENNNKGIVPDILRSYVWKTIEYGEELKMLREILRALPFEAKISI